MELSPTRDVLALLERSSMPTIAEVSAPVLRIAGQRINPRTNGPHRAQVYRSLSLKAIADGAERKVTLPPQPRLSWVGFSPDGKRFAFTQTGATGIELWLGDSATGQAKAVTPAQLNASLNTPCEWVGEGASLLCRFVAADRGMAPPAPAVPTGPNIQEHRGKVAPVRTYEDMLTSAHDEALFDYYASSQLAFVDATSGQRTPVGKPAIFEVALPSPDGNYVAVARVHRPYSWLVPYTNFPSTVEIWDRKGAAVKQIAELPVADTVPNGGVLPGPRAYQWQAARAGDAGLGGSARQRRPEDHRPESRQGDDARRAVQRRSRRSWHAPNIATATSRGPTAAPPCSPKTTGRNGGRAPG